MVQKLSRVNFFGYVGHATSRVGVLGLGLDLSVLLVSGYAHT